MLGLALSTLLDISPAHDFLRALLALVQEFESIPEERFGGKVVRQSYPALNGCCDEDAKVRLTDRWLCSVHSNNSEASSRSGPDPNAERAA